MVEKAKLTPAEYEVVFVFRDMFDDLHQYGLGADYPRRGAPEATNEPNRITELVERGLIAKI
ncbi:hypothetical protein EQG49_02320 [Periweissella cryptocerci]|uniref:Uncharacterized protein n=1 Tax=Periweissella cryptocerci TaxID=2506420 RepID=A0A4P6YRY9_9LACO|nr:hypothetical protein [Periweissella cryptocerci]QBO35382.1 hypothetical protein EQG49_02320 [Periweissella cryptocerci]